METPVYLCGSHAVGTVLQAAMHRLRAAGPTTSCCRSSASATTATWPTRARSTAGDVERALDDLGAEVAEGSVGAGHRDDLLRLPGRDRHRLARASATTTSACCCSATSATASTSTCSGLGARAPPPSAGPRPHGSCIAVCATDAPLSPQQLRRLALRPLLGLARAGSYARRGLGRDRPRLQHRRPRQDLSDERLNPLLRRRLRGRPRGGLQLPGRRAAGASGSTAAMQDAFPIEAVRRLG